MAQSQSAGKKSQREAAARSLLEDVIVPTAVNAAGEVGALVDRVAAFSRKSPGPALAASLLVGTLAGWLAARPRQPPDPGEQLVERARVSGHGII